MNTRKMAYWWDEQISDWWELATNNPIDAYYEYRDKGRNVLYISVDVDNVEDCILKLSFDIATSELVEDIPERMITKAREMIIILATK